LEHPQDPLAHADKWRLRIDHRRRGRLRLSLLHAFEAQVHLALARVLNAAATRDQAGPDLASASNAPTLERVAAAREVAGVHLLQHGGLADSGDASVVSGIDERGLRLRRKRTLHAGVDARVVDLLHRLLQLRGALDFGEALADLDVAE